MHEVKLGQLAGPDDRRDAIHVAVAPVIAAMDLRPGDHVRLLDDGQAVYVSSGDKTASGIVDPYLTDRVKEGQLFWLCLFPGTVTSLRHQWEHPAFGPEDAGPGGGPDKAASEAWLRKYAAGMGQYDGDDEAYDRLMAGLQAGELRSYGRDLYNWDDLHEPDELERHASIVLGRPVNLRSYRFSCSC